jgi:hypothetical protein
LSQFFNTLAHEKNFHPTKETNRWYNIKWDNVAKYKGGTSIGRVYKNYKAAIMAAYPATSLDIKKFGTN